MSSNWPKKEQLDALRSLLVLEQEEAPLRSPKTGIVLAQAVQGKVVLVSDWKELDVPDPSTGGLSRTRACPSSMGILPSIGVL